MLKYIQQNNGIPGIQIRNYDNIFRHHNYIEPIEPLGTSGVLLFKTYDQRLGFSQNQPSSYIPKLTTCASERFVQLSHQT